LKLEQKVKETTDSIRKAEQSAIAEDYDMQIIMAKDNKQQELAIYVKAAEDMNLSEEDRISFSKKAAEARIDIAEQSAKAEQSAIADDYDMQIIMAKDNKQQELAIYVKASEDMKLSEEDRIDFSKKAAKARIDIAEEEAKVIMDIVDKTYDGYISMIKGRMEIDKDAARQRVDLEKTTNRKREDILKDFNRKTFNTIEERRAAELKLKQDLDDLETEKTRAIQDNEESKKQAIEENADIIKQIYKDMAINFLKVEAAKSAAWFAGQIAAAVGKFRWDIAAALVVQGVASQAAFAGGMSLIQGLATGGIVAGEGLYRMGEKNKKEAVIPLETDAGKKALSNALGGGAGGTPNYINNVINIDGRTIAEVVTNYQSMNKLQGRA
jgi:hypothetical protein